MKLNSVIFAMIMMGLLAAAGLAGAASKGGGAAPSYPSAYEDDPRRQEWQKADKVLDALQIKQGDVVADIGAGTGFFSMLFAQRVGKSGIVYAVDVEEGMVKELEKRAKKEGRDNVRSILGHTDDPLLPTAAADLIFICDTYMFIEDREQYLLRLKNVMKQDSQLAIISFNRNAEIQGAPPRQKMISRERTILEADRAGFKLKAEYFFLPYQDFMVFVKK